MKLRLLVYGLSLTFSLSTFSNECTLTYKSEGIEQKSICVLNSPTEGCLLAGKPTEDGRYFVELVELEKVAYEQAQKKDILVNEKAIRTRLGFFPNKTGDFNFSGNRYIYPKNGSFAGVETHILDMTLSCN